jgi:hypothetical protein
MGRTVKVREHTARLVRTGLAWRHIGTIVPPKGGAIPLLTGVPASLKAGAAGPRRWCLPAPPQTTGSP